MFGYVRGQTVADLGCPDEEITLISLFIGRTPLGVDELGYRLSQPQDY